MYLPPSHYPRGAARPPGKLRALYRERISQPLLAGPEHRGRAGTEGLQYRAVLRGPDVLCHRRIQPGTAHGDHGIGPLRGIGGRALHRGIPILPAGTALTAAKHPKIPLLPGLLCTSGRPLTDRLGPSGYSWRRHALFRQ